MLVYNSRLIGTPVLSVQSGGPIGYIAGLIIDPNGLKTLAFRLNGPLVNKSPTNLLDVSSIREYSNYGFVIDDIDELVSEDEVVRISEVLKLNFDLLTLKVETKKRSKLGKIIDFTLTSEDFLVQQLIVKRPAIKAIIDPELIVPRSEIVEITDYKVIVKDEEKTIKKKAATTEFVPNFVNPFRKTELSSAPAQTKTPADKDN